MLGCELGVQLSGPGPEALCVIWLGTILSHWVYSYLVEDRVGINQTTLKGERTKSLIQCWKHGDMQALELRYPEAKGCNRHRMLNI